MLLFYVCNNKDKNNQNYCASMVMKMIMINDNNNWHLKEKRNETKQEKKNLLIELFFILEIECVRSFDDHFDDDGTWSHRKPAKKEMTEGEE